MKSRKEALRSTISCRIRSEDITPDLAAGAGKAAERLRRVPLYKESRRVMVTLDRTLVQVRLNVLTDRKKLFMPTRTLKDGFFTVDPQATIPPRKRLFAVQPHPGNVFAVRNRYETGLEPPVDLIVTDAVAVGRDGTLLGDGQGHLDLQVAILRELGWLHPGASVVAMVNECQIRDSLPIETHDVGVQWIVTPDASFQASVPQSARTGIMWEQLTARQIKRNSALFYLHMRDRGKPPREEETFS